MKFVVIAFCTCVVLASCKNEKNNNQPVTTTEDSSSAFIKSLVIGELAEVQKVPYFLYVIKQKTGLTKDSFSINKEQLANYFTPLFNLDVYKTNAKDLFTETSFEDLSTESISIIYNPKSAATVQTTNLTILLNNKNNQLKNFIAKTVTQKNDTTFYTQFHLKAKKSLTITTQAIYNNKEQYSSKEFVNWNDYLCIINEAL